MLQQLVEWKWVETVAKLATGDLVEVDLGGMAEPWRGMAARIMGMDRALRDGLPAERILWTASEGLDERNQVVDEVRGWIPDGEWIGTYQSLAELAGELEPVKWLWPGWIPRAMLSLLGAAPGAGKSLIALDLCRRIIHGDGFPDGARVARPGAPCIYVDAEAVPQLINERAVAWGMDRSRLYLMLPEDYGMLDFGDQAHQDKLIRMCYTLQPELVVIDSMSSISVRGENNVEDVRSLLGFLSAVAREFGCGLLLIHHLRKRNLPMLDMVSPDDFRGSSHIIAMARSVLGLSIVQVGPRPDRNGPRQLEVVKTNIAAYPQAMGIMFEPLGETGVKLSYDDAPRPYEEESETEKCAEWLLETLREAGEPIKPKELVGMAREVGFKRDMLYEARRKLGERVVNTEKKRSPSNCWGLADDEEA